jgi:DNA-binding MarR family transcriptional regulator
MTRIRFDVRLARREILKTIAARPHISRREIAEIVGCNEATVWRHLDALKQLGLITWTPKPGGATPLHYILLPEGVEALGRFTSVP